MYFVFCISKCILGGSWCWLGEAWSADGSSWDPTSWRHFHPSFLPPAMPCPSMEACWSLGSVLSWHFWSFHQLDGDKFCQRLWVGGVTSLPSSHSVFPSILYPPCTVFSNQSEWLIPRHNYTRLFVKFIATLCSTKIASPPFLFSCHTLSFSTNTRIGNLPQLETSSILDLTTFSY